MKKSNNTIFAVVVYVVSILCFTAVSHAAPGQANFEWTLGLTEIVDGQAVNGELHKTLTIFRAVDSMTPAILAFSEERPGNCGTAACPPLLEKTHFRVVSLEPYDRCGSKAITARELDTGEESRGQVLQIIDHSTRACDDLVDRYWQILLSEEPNVEPREFVTEEALSF